jgi:energy-coupling factor transport system ATP-binding protein
MISVRNLSYRYPYGERDVLSDISIEFADGSFTAIMGANGSGKSTLARCLNALRLPSVGDVFVDGMNTRRADFLPKIRRSVGLVFQDPNSQMTSATIERELAFGLQSGGIPQQEIQRRVTRELESLGFLDRRLSTPSSLSGGERQRLALAAAQMLEPSHLVLDEPTSFLSPTSRRKFIASVLRQRNENRASIIFITQFLDEALCADRLLVLHESRIVFDDIPDKVKTRLQELSLWGIFVSSVNTSNEISA